MISRSLLKKRQTLDTVFLLDITEFGNSLKH